MEETVHPLQNELAVMGRMADFVGQKYLFFGGLCKATRRGWGNRPKITRGIDKHTTKNQLRFIVDCGWKKHFTCEPIARLGSIELLEFARYTLECQWNALTTAAAARYGHLHLLEWLGEYGCPWGFSTSAAAAAGGHQHLLAWALAHDCPTGKSSCYAAAGGGHLDLLSWLRSKDIPWDKRTCSEAAKGGHVAVLEWARDHGCAWDEETCALAAVGGSLEALRYAREHGCPWDITTTRAAASEGHLEILEYARENGCPWDESVTERAAFRGQLEVLRWALENGCPYNSPNMKKKAGLLGRVEIINWLEQHEYWKMGFQHLYAREIPWASTFRDAQALKRQMVHNRIRFSQPLPITFLRFSLRAKCIILVARKLKNARGGRLGCAKGARLWTI